jgi:hypothetical protein
MKNERYKMKKIHCYFFVILVLFVFISCEESVNYSWQSEVVVTGNPVEMAMALDAMNCPQIVYIQNPDKIVRVAAGGDDGYTTMVVPDIGGDGCMEPSIAVDGQNHLHVSFMGWPGTQPKEPLYYALYDGSSWQVEKVLDLNYSNYAHHTTIAVDSTGKPHIAFVSPGNIGYATKTGTSWVIETAAVPPATSDCCDLALDANNQPHICYNAIMSGVKLYYASKSSGSWHSEEVGWGGAGCRVAVDESGNPKCGGYGDGVYLFSRNSDGWAPLCADSEGSTLDMTMDKRGRPCFAYQLAGSNAVRYAVYDDYKWLYSDVTGALGYDFSLKFSSDGTPHIAILDATDYTHSSISHYWNEGDCGW